MLQRQGTIGPEGEPVLPTREAAQQRQARLAAAQRNRTSASEFLHDVRLELRRVAWPTRAETVNYAVVVVICLAVLMALIFGLDTAFSKSMLFLFKK
jgi:preprotein translocase subunit SecE